MIRAVLACLIGCCFALIGCTRHHTGGPAPKVSAEDSIEADEASAYDALLALLSHSMDSSAPPSSRGGHVVSRRAVRHLRSLQVSFVVDLANSDGCAQAIRDLLGSVPEVSCSNVGGVVCVYMTGEERMRKACEEGPTTQEDSITVVQWSVMHGMDLGQSVRHFESFVLLPQGKTASQICPEAMEHEGVTGDVELYGVTAADVLRALMASRGRVSGDEFWSSGRARLLSED